MAQYTIGNTDIKNVQTPSQANTSGLVTALILAACMCIPVVLSLTFFLGQSLRLDEAQSLWQSSRSVGYIFTVVAEDVHVPLYHLLLHFWRILFGDTVASARFMSLFLYVASIPALYARGKLAYSRRVGRFGAFLCFDIAVYELVRQRNTHVHPVYFFCHRKPIPIYKNIQS